MKGRPQDNLEFMQWLKRFYDLHQNGQEKRSSSHRSYHSLTSSSPSSQGDMKNSPSCSLLSAALRLAKKIKIMPTKRAVDFESEIGNCWFIRLIGSRTKKADRRERRDDSQIDFGGNRSDWLQW